jgi:Leucine-rich repeat (LRR) protein
MKEKSKEKYKINKFIELRLEGKETVIYLNGNKYIQCKMILKNFHVDDLIHIKDYNSIDALLQNFDTDLTNSYHNISPKEEFWAHCSNLEVWSENMYDTQLLHFNLAFPLLKELAKLGDVNARKIFREEIGKRITSGDLKTVKYLILENYIENLTDEETEFIFRELKNLDLVNTDLKEFPQIIFRMINLEKLWLDHNKINKIPHKIERLKKLRQLSLWDNQIDYLPDSIGKLANLEELFLLNNKIQEIPNSIKNLNQLKMINLSMNKIKNGIEPLFRLSKLEKLELSNNLINKIPKISENSKSLKLLDLSYNKIKEIPNSIRNAKNLEKLYLSQNNIVLLPENLYNLKKLNELNIEGNNLKLFPNLTNNLPSLKNLVIDQKQYNNISKNQKERLKNKNIKIKVIKRKEN